MKNMDKGDISAGKKDFEKVFENMEVKTGAMSEFFKIACAMIPMLKKMKFLIFFNNFQEN